MADDDDAGVPFVFALKDLLLFFDHYLLDKFSPGMRDIFVCIQPVLEQLQNLQATAKAVIEIQTTPSCSTIARSVSNSVDVFGHSFPRCVDYDFLNAFLNDLKEKQKLYSDFLVRLRGTKSQSVEHQKLRTDLANCCSALPRVAEMLSMVNENRSVLMRELSLLKEEVAAPFHRVAGAQKALIEARKAATAATAAASVSYEQPAGRGRVERSDQGGKEEEDDEDEEEEEEEDEDILLLGIERVLRPHVRLARLLHRSGLFEPDTSAAAAAAAAAELRQAEARRARDLLLLLLQPADVFCAWVGAGGEENVEEVVETLVAIAHEQELYSRVSRSSRPAPAVSEQLLCDLRAFQDTFLSLLARWRRWGGYEEKRRKQLLGSAGSVMAVAAAQLEAEGDEMAPAVGEHQTKLACASLHASRRLFSAELAMAQEMKAVRRKISGVFDREFGMRAELVDEISLARANY